jgi:hypothetical protein
MTDDIHDTSRIDSFMASRRRAMFLHALWRPMLAGAAGAALIIGAAWVATPKIHYTDIEIPRVTMRDVTVDHVVPRDVLVDHLVPHDVPVASAAPPAPGPTMGPQSPYAPKTPDEKKFADKPEYKAAHYHGRIITSVDGRAISFQDGQSFWPAKLDATGKPVADLEAANDSDPYVGDLGMCVQTADHGMWTCSAMHDGQEVHIGRKPKGASAGTPPATEMVAVDVDVGGYPVSAMVDTGCSWPMSISSNLADALVKNKRATPTTPAKSTLADGSVQDVNVIVINQITIDGRVLQDVVAAVAPSEIAPTLLGLGALNRLGQYSINNGRIVFTSDQPA